MRFRAIGAGREYAATGRDAGLPAKGNSGPRRPSARAYAAVAARRAFTRATVAAVQAAAPSQSRQALGGVKCRNNGLAPGDARSIVSGSQNGREARDVANPTFFKPSISLFSGSLIIVVLTWCQMRPLANAGGSQSRGWRTGEAQ